MLITVVNKGNEVNYAIKKVIDLIHQFDNWDDIDKIRLSIYLLENKNFNVWDMIIVILYWIMSKKNP